MDTTTPRVTCPACSGHGEVPVPGTYGITVSPEALELRPCALCTGDGVVTQAEVDAHDAHVAEVAAP